MSLLCHCKPDELKLILIDPKRLEFAAYNAIGHLLFPIITQAKQAINALRWTVDEMENRYEMMKNVGARNISDYNLARQSHPDYEAMPYIVVIIDELADLMIVGGRDIEDLLTRITQMARAAGIHLLVATQRPSVDVITGVIKVNFPSRISFRVTSKVDSRTILDCNGAEKLLGRGDMLFLDAAGSFIKRIHGAYISDKEIAVVVNQIRDQQKAVYCELDEQGLEAAHMISNIDDSLYQEILAYVHDVDEISISLIQRRFRIGYNRSARIIETLEAQGIIAAADGGKMRKVLR
jgi:S-DNA-T family DNA segregation ATPase FtsK/SpoIIIE